MTSNAMLTGYRVLDMSQFVAGPTCGRMMAELGAEVIKLELAPYGDRSRSQGLRSRDAAYRKSSQSTYYFQHNHSKKSFAINIKTEEGRALLKRLVAEVDVIIENFAPGVMMKYGFSYENVKAINSRVVMCSISLAGQEGPLSSKPGYDYIGGAYSGIASMIGEDNGPPAQMTVAIGDVSTGIAAAMAVGFALLHRERTGEGQYIDASLIDTYFQMHEANVPKVAIRGEVFVPTRSGARHPDGGPVGFYRCRDGGYISICALQHQLPQLLKVMDRPELETDPRFETARGRKDNRDALDEIIEAWLDTLPGRDAAIERLESARVPCAPVLTLNEALHHPHLRARKTVRPVTDVHIGAFDIPGMPVKFSAWDEKEDLKADLLGEHNDYVLSDILGLSDEERTQLYESGVVVRDPLVT